MNLPKRIKITVEAIGEDGKVIKSFSEETDFERISVNSVTRFLYDTLEVETGIYDHKKSIGVYKGAFGK